MDYLRGLKENVIMGRLIPAGTGMEYYHRTIPGYDEETRLTFSGLGDDTSADTLSDAE